MKKNLEAVVRRCSVKKGSYKFRKIHRKAPALGSLFIRVTDLKCFHVNSAKFKDTYFVRNSERLLLKTMLIWIQLNNFPNSNLKTSIILAHRIGNAYTKKILSLIRSSCPEVLRPAIFFWKEALAQVFSCEFCEISKNIFSYRTPPVAASYLRRSSFLFSRSRLSSFLNFIKTWANLAKAREAWPWHSRSKIPKITGKSGLKLCKLIFVCG